MDKLKLMNRIYYPVPDFYREWLKDNPKICFVHDGRHNDREATLFGTNSILVFEASLANSCSHFYLDEWTRLMPDSELPDHLEPFFDLDELLSYKLYYIASTEQCDALKKKYGLEVNHIRNMHIMYCDCPTEIVNEPGYYYVDSDCSGVSLLDMIITISKSPLVKPIQTTLALEQILVKYIDVCIDAKQLGQRIAPGKLIPNRTLLSKGYCFFLDYPSTLSTVKLIEHGFAETEAERASSLPGLPAAITDGFEVENELRALAARSYMLSYRQWKKIREFIRTGLYS